MRLFFIILFCLSLAAIEPLNLQVICIQLTKRNKKRHEELLSSITIIRKWNIPILCLLSQTFYFNIWCWYISTALLNWQAEALTQQRITTCKEHFCILVPLKKEERRLCSDFFAELCVTANVLWLHLWLLSSAEEYFPNLCFPSRMAEEARYYKECFHMHNSCPVQPGNINGLSLMPGRCWAGSPRCRN